MNGGAAAPRRFTKCGSTAIVAGCCSPRASARCMGSTHDGDGFDNDSVDGGGNSVKSVITVVFKGPVDYLPPLLWTLKIYHSYIVIDSLPQFYKNKMYVWH